MGNGTLRALDKPPIHVDDKQEKYPQLVYDPIRRDVQRYLEEKSPALALSVTDVSVRRLADDTSYTGVFLAGPAAFWYLMTGKGFAYKTASDQDRARKAFDSFTQREMTRSKVIRQQESGKDLALLLDLGKSTRRERLRFKRSVGVDIVLPAKVGVTKALPGTGKEKPTSRKPRPQSTASTKKQGAGGRTRYTYPTEKGKPGAAPTANGPKTKRAGSPQAQEPQKEVKPREQVGGSKPQPQPDPVQVEFVDPSKLARLLRVDVNQLKKLATKLTRKKFIKFMMGKLKNFAEKHNLDAKYFGLVYDALTGMPTAPSTTGG